METIMLHLLGLTLALIGMACVFAPVFLYINKKNEEELDALRVSQWVLEQERKEKNWLDAH
jgi:hypothetical protein